MKKLLKFVIYFFFGIVLMNEGRESSNYIIGAIQWLLGIIGLGIAFSPLFERIDKFLD